MTQLTQGSDMEATLRVWFDVEIGHSACPDDETDENCKVNDFLALVSVLNADKQRSIDRAIVDELKTLEQMTHEGRGTIAWEMDAVSCYINDRIEKLSPTTKKEGERE